MYKKLIYTFLFVLFCSATNAQLKTSDAVMKDFMSRRFGLFIHWGPVSLRGTEIGWSRDKQVSKADYDSLYKEFSRNAGRCNQ